MTYFADYEIENCAAHIEAKRLANKLYARWEGLTRRLFNVVMDDPFDGKKFDGLSSNGDSARREFDNVLRGLGRCCHHA